MAYNGLVIGGPLDGTRAEGIPDDVMYAEPIRPIFPVPPRGPDIEIPDIPMMVERVAYRFVPFHTHDCKHGDEVFGFWVPWDEFETSHRFILKALTEGYEKK